VASGIEDIIIVTGRNKEAIEDHFDKSFELEEALKGRCEEELLGEVRRIANMANIYYVRQGEPLGLGHDVYCAKSFIGHEPFAVLLGDDVIDSDEPCLSQLIDTFNHYQSTVLGVQKVPALQVSKYGIINGRQVRERVFRVSDVIEKPDISKAPSNMAIIGRYIITPEIFLHLENVRPGKDGEMQLTDALKSLLDEETVFACEVKGNRYDAGDRLDYLKATIDFALKRDDMKYDLYRFMKDKADRWYARS